MPSTITTKGTDSDPLTTDREQGEAVGNWVARHNDSVRDCTPAGDTLSTTWNSAAGPKAKKTVRDPGESNGAFKLRHILEYTTAMIENPPI